MTSGPDRRAFFKHLLREAASVAQELNSAVRQAEEETFAEFEAPRPVRAAPARGSVNEETLLALCREVGLEHRTADVRRIARTSVRLTPGPPGGASRLGGAPDLPRDFAWPTWEGRDLAFLGQVDLEQVVALDAALPLPREGVLLFFYDLAERPSGLHPSHRGSCRVVLVDRGSLDLEPDDERAPVLRALPVELSREVMLPVAWSLQAEELELSPEDMDGWAELRIRLAAAQGIELEESTAETFALHRLLGYQDEFGREVEFDCQLASAGLDADEVSVYWESRTEHEIEAREWRLLFQLSSDDALGTTRGDELDRLFVCVPDRELQRGNFDAAWAVLR